MCLDDSESELIRLAAAGDRAALSKLLLIHYDELVRHISRRITGDLRMLMRSEDILQQTFIRAALAIAAFRERRDGSLLAWLKTIAANLVKDAQKRRRRERRATGERFCGWRPGDRSSAAALVEKIAGESTTPGHRAQRRENVRCMQAALASLPAEQREVIQRHYVHGQSFAHIAQAMNRTKDAVRGMCYRARKDLRAIMGRSSLYWSG